MQLTPLQLFYSRLFCTDFIEAMQFFCDDLHTCYCSCIRGWRKQNNLCDILVFGRIFHFDVCCYHNKVGMIRSLTIC